MGRIGYVADARDATSVVDPVAVTTSAVVEVSVAAQRRPKGGVQWAAVLRMMRH